MTGQVDWLNLGSCRSAGAKPRIIARRGHIRWLVGIQAVAVDLRGTGLTYRTLANVAFS